MDCTYVVAVVIVFPSIAIPCVRALCPVYVPNLSRPYPVTRHVCIFSGSRVSNMITTLVLFLKAERPDVLM